MKLANLHSIQKELSYDTLLEKFEAAMDAKLKF